MKAMTTKEIALIARYRKEGLTLKQIAVLMKRSRTTIGLYCSPRQTEARRAFERERYARMKESPELMENRRARSRAYVAQKARAKGGDAR